MPSRITTSIEARAGRTAFPALLSLLAAVALAMTGCASIDPDGAGADIVNQPNSSAAPGTTRTGDAPGTRQKPVPAGTTVKIGDWQVTLGPTVLNATAQVTAKNRFNDPPAAGRQFVMVPVNLTYNGPDSGTPWVDLSFHFHGSGGNTFGRGGEDDHCGVIPTSLSDVSEMFPNAKASGNVCVSVPTDQVQGGAWIVEETLALDSNRVFFALQ
ncbi:MULTISPECIES: hypothetical protein [unclassified Frankia]|uniref:hypothetical protein n=1 Tax=unclassified Frankia TaxID=2632575 RepID=UPI0020243763